MEEFRPNDIVWKFDGHEASFVKWNSPEEKISPLTGALHYAIAAFEGIALYNTERGPAIFRGVDHFSRLLKSSRFFYMNPPYNEYQLVDILGQVFKKNNRKEGYGRPVVFPVVKEMDGKVEGRMGVGVFEPYEMRMYTWGWGKGYLGNAKSEGARVAIINIEGIPASILPPDVKLSAKYAPLGKARSLAKLYGYDEALVVGSQGNILEGTGEAIVGIRGNKVFVTRKQAPNLRSITRGTIITLAQELGYEVLETDFLKPALSFFDELILAGTAAELTPVRELDEIVSSSEYPEPEDPAKIKRKEISKFTSWPNAMKLQLTYDSVVRGKDQKHLDWLNFIDEK